MNIRSLYRPGDTASCISRFVDFTSSLFHDTWVTMRKEKCRGSQPGKSRRQVFPSEPDLTMQLKRDVSVGRPNS